MSLLVWLPLQGTLENKGTDNAIIQSSGATIDVNGKLGKCYSFDGNDDYISISDPDIYKITTGTNPFSIAMWIYHADSTRAVLFGDYGLANTKNFNVELTTGHIVRFYWAGSPDYSSTVNIGASTWAHIVITYDGSNLNIYLNGTLAKTRSGTLTGLNKTAGDFYLGRDSRTGTTAFYGKMNDFRVYDHCLSVAEIKELSFGLVAHYKLDRFASGYGNPNLCNNSRTFGTGFGGSGVTQSYSYNGFAVKYKDNSEGTSNTDVVTYNNVTTVNPSEVYTASFWAKADENLNATCYFYNNGSELVQVSSGTSSTGGTTTGLDGNILVALTPEWKRYWITWTFTSTGTAATKSFIIRSMAGTKGIYVAGVKLEKGNISTEWAPSITEDASAFATVADSSGYGHNAIIIGTATIVESAKYINGLYMDNRSSANRIEAESLPSTVQTISAWVKGVKSDNHVYFADYNSGLEFGTIYNGGATNMSSKPLYTLTNFVDGEWNHVVVVKNSTNNLLYINGVAETTTSSNNYYIHNEKLYLLNRSYNNSYAANASISDVRAYLTALSAREIKELYQVAQRVDNKDSIHGFDYDEKTNIALTRKITTVGSLSESKALTRIKYDTNIYIEPDGSAWVRIFHHNNPGAGSFNSTDNFEHSVYLDENRWFNMEVCYEVTQWELMVKGKFTATSDEWKVRWIQQYNPMTATFADVAAANVTKITNGYSSTPSSWGGMYAKKGSTYLSANNGTSGNWWGAVGSYSVYQNGIPGWGPSTTVTTTGFNDVYLRIDNLINDIPENAQFKKSGIMTAAQFIEM